MEATLTKCLTKIRDDLTDLKRLREYLDSQPEPEENSWRTIEAYNSVLAVCASQENPETEALDTLLDSFYYVATCNHEEKIWNNFGFELGVIAVKILSIIEKTDMFEVLFCKLLTVINAICEHNTDTWKAVARQILNVFINKKFSFSFLETVLKLYNCILRNVEPVVLHNFAQKNLNLLKTLSKIVQRMGDFETQTNIMELVFLHTSNDQALMEDFFTDVHSEAYALLKTLQFIDFEKDTRTYLNVLNNSLGTDRKVFSINCYSLHLGGCALEPPTSRTVIWLDANKDSERISIKCADFQSDSDSRVRECVVYLTFQDIKKVQVECGSMSGENCYVVTLHTKNLKKVYKDVQNDEVVCVALEGDNGKEAIPDFFNFIEEVIRKCEERKKLKNTGERMSQTSDEVCIDRSVVLGDAHSSPIDEVPENLEESVTANFRRRSGINRLIPDVLSLFKKVETNAENTDRIEEPKNPPRYVTSEEISVSIQNLTKRENGIPYTGTLNEEVKFLQTPQIIRQSPTRHENRRTVVLETQELTPNSFVESLNKNLGIDSQEGRRSFEDSVEQEVIQSSSGKKSHRLFTSPVEFYNFWDDEDLQEKGTIQEEAEDKENVPPKKKSSKRKDGNAERKQQLTVTSTRVLRDRTNLEGKLFGSQSEECFRGEVNMRKKKKPTLPNLKRNVSREKRSGAVSNEGKVTRKSEQQKKQMGVNAQRKQSKGTNEKDKTKVAKTRQNKECLVAEIGRQKKTVERGKKTPVSTNEKKEDTAKTSVKPTGEAKEKKTDPSKELQVVKTSTRQTTGRPSLLDPNGYAYQRWKQPTTSERSNFWLKKLDKREKEKKTKNIFDFSDDSDSELQKKRKANRKVVTRRRRTYVAKKPKKVTSPRRSSPMKEIKNILRSIGNVKLEQRGGGEQKATRIGIVKPCECPKMVNKVKPVREEKKKVREILPVQMVGNIEQNTNVLEASLQIKEAAETRQNSRGSQKRDKKPEKEHTIKANGCSKENVQVSTSREKKKPEVTDKKESFLNQAITTGEEDRILRITAKLNGYSKENEHTNTNREKKKPEVTREVFDDRSVITRGEERKSQETKCYGEQSEDNIECSVTRQQKKNSEEVECSIEQIMAVSERKKLQEGMQLKNKTKKSPTGSDNQEIRKQREKSQVDMITSKVVNGMDTIREQKEGRNGDVEAVQDVERVEPQEESSSSDYSIQDFTQRSTKVPPSPQTPSVTSEYFGNDLRPDFDYIERRRSSSDISYGEDDTNFQERNDKNEESDDIDFDINIESDLEEAIETKKRERSEESSQSRRRSKKKTKRECAPTSLPLTLQLRLQKVEEKAKAQTDEIIGVIQQATNQLFNHIQRKDAEDVASYLKVAEEVASELEGGNDLDVRGKRIERLLKYFQAGCSVSDSCDVTTVELTKIREGLKDLKKGGGKTSRKIDRFSGRLKSLIKSDIEKTIRNEFFASRKRLMECVSSAFDVDLDQLQYLQ